MSFYSNNLFAWYWICLEKLFPRLLLYIIFYITSLKWIYSPRLSFASLFPSPRSNYKMLFCATETMQEIYWPRVPPFDTRDVANRSCAISHLLRLLCKADLSCLQAIFKLWVQKTYGAMGNFIITALHLSDLIQACRGLCQSNAIYLHSATANKGKLDHRHLSQGDGEWSMPLNWAEEKLQDDRLYLQCRSLVKRSEWSKGMGAIVFRKQRFDQTQRNLTTSKIVQIAATDTFISLYHWCH